MSEEKDDFLDLEVKYAQTLCKTACGLSPDIKFTVDFQHKLIYDDDEGNEHVCTAPGSPITILWEITGGRQLAGEHIGNAAISIKVGPYRSLLRCICEWNRTICKLSGTTFACDLFEKENK